METQTYVSLQKQLDALNQELTEKLPVKAEHILQHKTHELESSGIRIKCFKKGEYAPDFDLPNVDNRYFRLSDMLRSGPVVVSFYRGGWCPYCHLELRTLQKALPEIRAYEGQLVAISPQIPDKSLTTMENARLSYPVLSDIDNAAARRYGLVFTLADELRAIYEDLGVDIPSHNGLDHFELPIPATYVIDPQGIIRYAFIKVDYTQRAEPTEIINVLASMPSFKRNWK